MDKFWRALALAGLGIVVSGMVGACSGETAKRRLSALADGCTINSDCDAPLVCAFRKCHTECENSRDCPPGTRCMASDRPFHVCQLPEEQNCSYNSDCPEGQLCGVDGECRDQCASNRDCVNGQVCTAAACAEPDELNVNGELTPSGDAGTATGAPCIYSSECTAPLVCRLGNCVPECIQDVDCPRGYGCSGGACVVVPPSDAGQPQCVYNSQCPQGQVCSAGRCIAECQADRDCPTGSTCVGGACTLPESGAIECYYTSECGADRICRNNRCIAECATSVDCAFGFQCFGGRCILPGIPDSGAVGYGTPCSVNSDCLAYDMVCGSLNVCVFECRSNADCLTAGTCCQSNHCVTDLGTNCQQVSQDAGVPVTDGGACATDLDCDDGKFCTGPRICVAGSCRTAGTVSACDDRNPCTLDGCDEAGKTCSHVTTAPVDVDKDNHFDKACGGLADDCDDTNGAVYPGHIEDCDGVDNNCDGITDEGAWKAGPVVNISVNDPQTFIRNAVGAPAIARLTDGTFVIATGGKDNSTLTNTYPLYGWHTSAALVPLAPSPPAVTLHVPTATPSEEMSIWPSIATNGSTVALGMTEYGNQSGGCGTTIWDGYAGVAPGDLSLSATWTKTATWGTGSNCPLTNTTSTIFVARPAMAFNGTNFVAAWADVHETGNTSFAYVYAASMTPSGVLSGTHTVLGTASETAAPTGYALARVQLAVGTSSAIVAWRSNLMIATRYVILDTNLQAVLAGPFDLSTEPEDFEPTGAAFVGTSFALVTQAVATSADPVRVHRIDAATGTRLAHRRIENPAGGNDARFDADAQLTAVNGGFAVALSRGTTVTWGWAREDLAGGFTLVDVVAGQTSSAGIVAAGQKSAAMVWSDGTDIQGTVMTCTP